ncbi:MAG: MBL fold metallo-hydrolase [Lachnospiraceae bacterium]|nr:MBL fold metallo-hydrolase [Lachnospiraceae bacterium]
MLIKYLGTGAAEGIPAVFCHCKVCQYARVHKGKNIRTRSQALIDGKLLLDFGPDTFLHSLEYGIQLANIEVCLITHAHDDHLYLEDLRARRRSRANLNPQTPALCVYGGNGVKTVLKPREDGYVTKDNSVLFCTIKPFEQVEVLGKYKVTAIPAVHNAEEPFVYVIQSDGHAFLYGHDTDYFEKNVWDYFRTNEIYFDAVSLDCTEGIKHIEYSGHMNFERMQKMCARLRKEGCIDDTTKIIANHISHNGLVNHDKADEVGKALGYLVSYDGMEINV